VPKTIPFSSGSLILHFGLLTFSQVQAAIIIYPQFLAANRWRSFEKHRAKSNC